MSKQSDLTNQLFRRMSQEFQDAFLLGVRTTLDAVRSQMQLECEADRVKGRAEALEWLDHQLSQWSTMDVFWRYGQEPSPKEGE